MSAKLLNREKGPEHLAIQSAVHVGRSFTMKPMRLKEFIAHANFPGPVRLEVDRAVNSGAVNADPMFMAVRQAIINHVWPIRISSMKAVGTTGSRCSRTIFRSRTQCRK